MKTLFSLAACLLALTLAPPSLPGEAHSGPGRFQVSGHLCPSIDLSSLDLTPILEKDRGGGDETLIIWARESCGSGERVDRFIQDGDPISSSGLPPPRAGIGALMLMWLQLNFPEATEGARLWYDIATVDGRLRSDFVDSGALLARGRAKRTIELMLGAKMNNEAVMVLDPLDCSDWDINPNTDTKRWLSWIQKTPAVRRRRTQGALCWVSLSNRVLMILGLCGAHLTIFGLGLLIQMPIEFFPDSSLQKEGVGLCCVSLSLLLLLFRRFRPKGKEKL